ETKRRRGGLHEIADRDLSLSHWLFLRRGFRGWIRCADVAEILGKINAKPPSERQILLVENTKKEAALTFYSGTNSRDLQEIVTAFNKHYPFIRVAFSSLGGP